MKKVVNMNQEVQDETLEGVVEEATKVGFFGKIKNKICEHPVIAVIAGVVLAAGVAIVVKTITGEDAEYGTLIEDTIENVIGE